jgi:hypothetical protein
MHREINLAFSYVVARVQVRLWVVDYKGCLSQVESGSWFVVRADAAP